MLSRMIPFFAAPGAVSYQLSRTLDRTFVDTPASGGGNVAPDTFTHNGQTWEVWQAIPFLGSGVSPVQVGDARLHLRNRAIERDAMQLADMPSRIEMAQAAWTGSPWTFTRTASAAKFTSPGSGDEARRSIDYEPDRVLGGSPTAASLGILQGQVFMLTLYFD